MDKGFWRECLYFGTIWGSNDRTSRHKPNLVMHFIAKGLIIGVAAAAQGHEVASFNHQPVVLLNGYAARNPKEANDNVFIGDGNLLRWSVLTVMTVHASKTGTKIQLYQPIVDCN